jgi:hypothetical protein
MFFFFFNDCLAESGQLYIYKWILSSDCQFLQKTPAILLIGVAFNLKTNCVDIAVYANEAF